MTRQENMIDFENSFFLWKTLSGSEGRFILESITEVTKDEFLLLSSVMACDVYGNNPLFHDPSYLFEAVFGNDDFKVFRTYQQKTANTVNKIKDVFISTHFLKKTEIYSKLESFDEIAEAVRNGYRLSGQVKYDIDHKTALIRFPIKHINVSEMKREFQVETGKVLFYYNNLEQSLLAYLAFKNFNRINFLTQKGHSTNIVSYKAEIEIYKINKK